MKVMCIFGTRPEAIKMATVVNQFKALLGNDAKVCITAQHRHMLDQVMNLFSIQSDYDLDLMQNNQNLVSLSQRILQGVSKVLEDFKPDRIVVQGDTTTTFFASLAAFYARIPIAHIEAGLRSGDRYSPWPEEVNRKLTTHLADLHFAPTQGAADNLLREGIAEDQIFVTGNTVIDALLTARDTLNTTPALLQTISQQFSFLDYSKKIILVTGHRRENFGKGFQNICEAIKTLAQLESVQIVYPVHLNPNVRNPVMEMLSSFKNVHLLEPLDYLPFIYLMEKSHLILTDSGGIQEEAPALGKPVLVMRNVTERPEGVHSGTIKMVGTDCDKIVREVKRLLSNKTHYLKMSVAHNPYGDGKATDRIVAKILDSY